ncbi:UNVERIFIED_CONTAM: hypothetical protein FKN15_022354 [Acipenser sinensis]
MHEVPHCLLPVEGASLRDPKESRAIPESEAQERSETKAVYKQEESFEQEWCASLMQITEPTHVKDEEVPEQECVPIKEEHPSENSVCTLEEANQLGSILCDDPPSELGFRGQETCLSSDRQACTEWAIAPSCDWADQPVVQLLHHPDHLQPQGS